jgi:hypothetical protein
MSTSYMSTKYELVDNRWPIRRLGVHATMSCLKIVGKLRFSKDRDDLLSILKPTNFFLHEHLEICMGRQVSAKELARFIQCCHAHYCRASDYNYDNWIPRTIAFAKEEGASVSMGIVRIIIRGHT